MSRQGQRSRGGRSGNVFALRVDPLTRQQLEELCARDGGPRALGPWLVWRALQVKGRVAVLPELGAGAGITVPGAAVPTTRDRPGSTQPARVEVPIADRVILDLCAGSGAWSEPYRAAGYPVRRVTLPSVDVRTFVPPPGVWGVLAAPPCTEFSLAKNGHPRDFVEGLACVNACLRVVLTAAPRWWALENPVGLLGRWLGRPADVFEPCDFGDPWSKRTALWGRFNRPARGPFVQPIAGGGPLCSVCHPDDPRPCALADHRAVTAPGFARRFFEANP